MPYRCPAGTFLFFVAGVLSLAPSSTRLITWDFNTGVVDAAPEGFRTHSGIWEVTLDGENKVLAQRAENREPASNLTLVDGTSYKNVQLSVRVKMVGGENERGGGLVWRAQDENNFYLARYNPHTARHNPREPNFRLYLVENGRRIQLDHASVLLESPEQSQWHTLRITMVGERIEGFLDGVKLLEAEDSTFLDVGQIGLWSRSDACPYFDELTVSGL